MSWETAEFEMENMEEFDLSMEAICVPVRPGHILMPNKRNFTNHHAVCRKFHGKTSIVTNYEIQTFMFQTALPTMNGSCKRKLVGTVESQYSQLQCSDFTPDDQFLTA